MATVDDYTWIHDSHLAVAACITVVPAADRAAVLAAYGVREDTAFTTGSSEEAPDPFLRAVVHVVEVGDAVLVIEDNGFEGSRPEVLEPLSRASRAGLVASYFWNVEALTALSLARAGTVELSVDLYAIEAGDEELDELPAELRPIALQGGSDDGDPTAAGLAMVAILTDTPFTAATLGAGTWYEIDPTPAALRARSTRSFDPLAFLLGATDTITSLEPRVQRELAEWATAAAAREAGMADDPVVRQALHGFGTGAPAPAPDGLDQLVRTTAREHTRFRDLEADLEAGGVDWPRDHPYVEAVVDGPWGPVRAISHLEGCYLAQRYLAVEAVRRSTNPDPLAAAVDCLDAADGTFREGRTTRGWTFEEKDEGRWRRDTRPDARHQQWVSALAGLLTDLSDGAHDPWGRADAALPAPLSERERQEAIRSDAEADARGEFSTYQVAVVDDVADPAWADGWDDEWAATFDDDRDGGGRDAAGPVLHLTIDLEEDSSSWAVRLMRLALEVRRLDAMLLALARPEEVLSVIAAAPSAIEAPSRLAAALGIDRDQAWAVLGVRLQPPDPDEGRRLRARRDELADEVEALRRL